MNLRKITIREDIKRSIKWMSLFMAGAFVLTYYAKTLIGKLDFWGGCVVLIMASCYLFAWLMLSQDIMVFWDSSKTDKKRGSK